jgi:hypothetical protein
LDTNLDRKEPIVSYHDGFTVEREIASRIRKEYKVDSNGNITNPGKFEGEKIYVPYFWELNLNGEGEYSEKTENSFCVQVDSEIDFELFPEIDRKKVEIVMQESSDGFITEVN